MALSKLWGVFDTDASAFLPQEEVRSIRHNFKSKWPNISVETNPVVKKSLDILNVDGTLTVVEVHQGQNEEQAVANTGTTMTTAVLPCTTRANQAQVMNYIKHVERQHNQQLQQIQAQMQANHLWLQQQFDRVVNNQ